LNDPNESKEILENLFYDGKIVTNTLLSGGSPEDWTEDNVIKIGILSDNKINQTKLEYFYNLTQTNYNNTKILFNTRYDYLFFLSENMTLGSEEIEYIGKNVLDKDNVDTYNLVKITRFTSYNGRPVTSYLYIWGDY